MSSPFPGMNPWLERPGAWHDFHQQLCVECRRLLVPQLVPRYFAKLEEHLSVHELPAEERRLFARGDVVVSARRQPVVGARRAAILEPPRLLLRRVEPTHTGSPSRPAVTRAQSPPLTLTAR